MFKKLQQLQAIIAYKNSENLGDIAILKSDFFGATLKTIGKNQLRM